MSLTEVGLYLIFLCPFI